MRIGLLGAATLASCSLALAQNVWSTPESPGIVVAGDFNADGCDASGVVQPAAAA